MQETVVQRCSWGVGKHSVNINFKTNKQKYNFHSILIHFWTFLWNHICLISLHMLDEKVSINLISEYRVQDMFRLAQQLPRKSLKKKKKSIFKHFLKALSIQETMYKCNRFWCFWIASVTEWKQLFSPTSVFVPGYKPLSKISTDETNTDLLIQLPL